MPLERVLGAEVGAIYRDIHVDHGVELLLGTRRRGASRATRRVERVRTRRRTRARLRLRRRRRRRAAAHRAAPRPRASPSTTASSSTSTCRPAPRASSPPATSPTPATPSTARASASSTGPTRSTRARPRPAACSAQTRRYDRLPYFFSDQYDVGMEYSGFARRLGPGRLPRRSRRRREFIAFWLADDRVVAGHERQRVGRHRARSSASSARAPPVDDRRLADPDVPLEELAPGD